MRNLIGFALSFVLTVGAALQAQAAPRRAAGSNSNRTVYANSNAEPVSYFRKSSMDGYRDSRPSLYSISPVVSAFSSSLRGDKISDSQFGMQAGASLLMGIYKMHYEVGAYYARRGGGYSLPGDIKGQVDLEYIEIPTLIRYAFSPYDQTHFFTRAGLVWAGLLSARHKASNSTSEVQEVADDGYNFLDPRALIGFGTNIRLSSAMFLTVQAEYQRSLMTIRSDAQYARYNDSLGVSTGVVFPLLF